MDTKNSISSGQRFAPFAEKMEQDGLSTSVIDLFREYYHDLLTSGSSCGLIAEEEIQPVSMQELKGQDELSLEDKELGLKKLKEAAVLKLNGGLGTSMGMPYAKSLLVVKSGYTFLDIIIAQAKQAGMQLVLMESFNTRKDVQDYLDKAGVPESQRPISFMQNKYPKVLADSLESAEHPEDPDLDWNPPGHGDLFAALYSSGTLENLLDKGKKYLFVSNADNLGAGVDPAILGNFVASEAPFMMEVATRTKADSKGGHLARLQDGRLVLREVAQCKEEELKQFQDTGKYCFFNTNNIWLNLQALMDYIQKNGLPKLPLIVNPKTLDPRDESSPKVYQFESAMGAAISLFAKSRALHVDRSRFVPVKKSNDLLAVRSDCYILQKDWQLKPNPERKEKYIFIDLDSEFYKKIDQFEERFPAGPPSLLACSLFQVKGDVLFEAGVKCEGEVKVVNSKKTQQRISQGSRLKGEVYL